MASAGHQPVTNFDRRESFRESSLILESAGPQLTSKPTLGGYRPPRRRRRSRLLLEAAQFADRAPFTEAARFASAADAAEAAEEVPLLDVASASFGSAVANATSLVLEAVIGDDDRMKVDEAAMRKNPFRQICALRITSQTDRTFVGTGWFIGPGVLATAGHCVFLQDEGGWAKSITVIPAKQGSLEPLNRFPATRFASVDGWVDKRGRDFDYGAIFLDDRTPGTRVGNFAVEALPASELRLTDAQISGYPADRERAEFQFFHLRPMVDVTDARLVYDIDTFGGQSGSPIWQDTKERGVIAVGIHTTGGVSSNSGTRITGDVLENLVRWTTE
jgi:V8-like Glu-specific endopeptidase